MQKNLDAGDVKFTDEEALKQGTTTSAAAHASMPEGSSLQPQEYPHQADVFMQRRVTRRAFLVSFLFVAVFTADHLTKMYFMAVGAQYIVPLRPELFSNIIDITFHQNFGLIANLRAPSWFILAVTTLVLVAIGWKLVDELRQAPSSKLQATSYALSLIAGGALGNLYDRVTMGYVFDWILLFGRSAINLADVAIAGGIGWYLFAHRKTSQDSAPSVTA